MSDSKGVAIDGVLRPLALKIQDAAHKNLKQVEMGAGHIALLGTQDASDAIAEAKQAILALLAQEVKKSRAKLAKSILLGGGEDAFIIANEVRQLTAKYVETKVLEGRKQLLDSLIDEEIQLDKIYDDDQKLCVGIKIMADAVRRKYDD